MIKSPNPETYYENRDYRHTFKGFFYGTVVVLLSLVSVVWFMTSQGHGHDMDVVNKLPITEE